MRCIMELNLTDIELHETFKHRSAENLDLEDLMESIDSFGLVHPPTVRPLSRKGKYELVAGFRRFGAIQGLKWKKTDFNVMDMDARQAMSISLTENAGRKDLTPIEEAKSFRSAIETVGMKTAEVAKVIRKSNAYVSNRLRLLLLIKDVQTAIDKGKISPGHAEHSFFLLQDDEKLQKALLKEVCNSTYPLGIASSKSRAQSLIHEKKGQLALIKARKDAKFPLCPNCKTKASSFAWSDKSRFKCEKNGCHAKGSTYLSPEWSPKTGKVLNEQDSHPGIKAAQEARAKMEAPRTAYWDTDMEKVKKQAYKKAVELLKSAVLGKDSVNLTVGRHNIQITAQGDYYNKVELSLKDCYFQVMPIKDKSFVTTKIPYGEPTKKKYGKIAEIMGYPDQLRHTGKPMKDGPGKITDKPAATEKVLSSKSAKLATVDKKKHAVNLGPTFTCPACKRNTVIDTGMTYLSEKFPVYACYDLDCTSELFYITDAQGKLGKEVSELDINDEGKLNINRTKSD